jgi:hypothetical protein
MQSLTEQAKLAHASAPASVRMEPSIPILYFGDYNAYRCSKLRIVTVGKNPSWNEFPSHEPFRRFPAAARSDQEAWNRYFAVDPYKGWFSTYDQLLTGFDASFYGTAKNTAIHTDLLSPIATNPTWSGLAKTDQAALEKLGIPLWHDLIEHLKPHILLISVANEHKIKIKFNSVQAWRTVFSVAETQYGQPRKTPYEISHSVMQISDGFQADVLFGTGKQKPFDTLANLEKRKIGEVLKNKLTNW